MHLALLALLFSTESTASTNGLPGKRLPQRVRFEVVDVTDLYDPQDNAPGTVKVSSRSGCTSNVDGWSGASSSWMSFKTWSSTGASRGE